MAVECVIIVDPHATRGNDLLERVSARYRTVLVPTGDHALKRIKLKNRKPDAVLVASSLREGRGLNLGPSLREALAKAPCFVMVYGPFENRAVVPRETIKAAEKRFLIDQVWVGEYNGAAILQAFEEATGGRAKDVPGPAASAFRVQSAKREDYEPTWSDLLTSEVSVDAMKSALKKEVVAPVEIDEEEEVTEVTWSEALRLKADFRTLKKIVKGEVKVSKPTPGPGKT